jgi:hypothetical protein
VAFGWFVSWRRFVTYVEIKRNIGWEVADWINLARERDKCRAVVNTVMNFSTK